RFILRTSDYIASVLPAVLVDLANKDRSEQKLAYLKINPKLEAAARLKAKDMAEKGYFAHYSPEGVSPWHWIKESDYNFIYAGENLAVNFDDSGAVNTAWMASPGHRANILNDKFTEIGIASQKGYYNGRETTFVVQMFGAPAKTEVAVLPKPTPVPVKSESALVAISNVSQNFNVLGESEENLAKQIFIAVKDTSAESEVMPANTVQTAYSGSVAKFVSSPTKV
ncbi:MAG: CAP domain-containing protein, partial [Patescibacteria group bacterium]